MSYQIIIPKPVQKQLDRLPNSVYTKIIKKIQLLAVNPRPEGVIKVISQKKCTNCRVH